MGGGRRADRRAGRGRRREIEEQRISKGFPSREGEGEEEDGDDKRTV
jgi:hypothetical protein